MTVRNRQVRAAEYRRLALAASSLADASVLSHVREKHELAAATWESLAEMDERPITIPPARAPAAALAPGALFSVDKDELCIA